MPQKKKENDKNLLLESWKLWVVVTQTQSFSVNVSSVNLKPASRHYVMWCMYMPCCFLNRLERNEGKNRKILDYKACGAKHQLYNVNMVGKL